MYNWHNEADIEYKVMKRWTIPVGVVAARLLFPTEVFAQAWVQTSAPSKTWTSIACSADGSRLAATASPGSIYTSTNFGATWGTNYVPNLSWSAVAMSADGGKLVASAVGASVYTSTNFGSVWNTNNVPNYSYYSAAANGDGSVLAAITPVGNDVFVYTSPTGGWQTNHFPGGIYDGYCIGLSANGARLAAGNNIGIVLTSTNLAGSWATTNSVSTGTCKAIAVSADGSRLATVFNNANIYVSTNGGTAWRTNNFPGNTISSIATTPDGKTMFAVGGAKYFVSTDFGLDWTSGTMPAGGFVSLAMSADGNVLAAAQSSGGIWVSQIQPSPQLKVSFFGPNPKISWTVPSTNFVLQQSLDLQTWTAAANLPSLNYSNLQDEVSVTNSGGGVYYRLKTP
jgi:hypothetical protein